MDDTPVQSERVFHLWDYEHDYYCNLNNYYSNDCLQEYTSWQSFTREYGNVDMDYNLLFRWDWEKATPDNELNHDQLQLYFMQQRKGRFVSCIVLIRDEDEPAVREYLTKYKAHLDKLWMPIESD